MVKNKGIAEKRTAKLYINHFERNHLDNQNDMLTIIESMVLLVNNGFYEHPFAINENVIRISEKQLDKIVSECVSKVLRKI